MILRNSLFIQNVLHVTNLRNVYELSNGRKKGERCSFVEFPHHPHRSQRRSCGAALFKAVRSKHGELILKAKRVFCYRSVKKTLQEFLKRPGFSEKCEQYKKCPWDPNFLGDIYESGRISRVQKESPSLMPPIHLDACWILIGFNHTRILFIVLGWSI